MLRYHNLFYLCLFMLCSFNSCNSQQDKFASKTIEDCYHLHQLAKPLGKPFPYEWRASYKEPYESLKNYTLKNPLRATSSRSKLYLMPIGNFDSTAQHVFQITQIYLAQYFQIATDTLSCILPKNINPKAFRTKNNREQLNATYLLDSIIKPNMPKDAVAIIGLTTWDIYPDDSWNYVFGLARTTQGIGVWSLSRLGKSVDSIADPMTLLNRTLKVAAHETGHILGITHCVKNHCCMNGSLNLPESDAQPEWLCWECLAKLCWNRNKSPLQHLNSLLQFHTTITKDTAAIAYYKKAIAILQ